MMKTIASHNGLLAVERAWKGLQEGETALDACVEGVTLVEDDPNDLTVGYGGLPNEDGIVELDAAVMDGARGCGAGVAALQDTRHPTQVARCLMQQTHRVLLVGEGAQAFARANGFPAEPMLTDRARRMWLYWKRTRSTQDDWRAPSPEELGAEDLELKSWLDNHFYKQPASGKRPDAPPTGTVHCAALDGNGDLACATSTSGHAFKLAGRVGDSPILGAGLYADNEGGACGSIGHGEANLQCLSSFAAVERLRNGESLRDAALAVMQRIVDKCPRGLCDAQGRPKFDHQLFLLNRQGEHLGVSIWPNRHIAVTDENGTRLEDCLSLYAEPPAA